MWRLAPLIPALERQKQVDYCEFQDSLVCMSSPRDPVTKEEEKKKRRGGQNKVCVSLSLSLCVCVCVCVCLWGACLLIFVCVFMGSVLPSILYLCMYVCMYLYLEGFLTSELFRLTHNLIESMASYSVYSVDIAIWWSCGLAMCFQFFRSVDHITENTYTFLSMPLILLDAEKKPLGWPWVSLAFGVDHQACTCSPGGWLLK